MRRMKLTLGALAIAAVAVTGACTKNTGRGALIGGAAGAGLGALSGRGILGSAATGAVAGGAGGFIYDQVKRH